jgi:hypothetical protein
MSPASLRPSVVMRPAYKFYDTFTEKNEVKLAYAISVEVLSIDLEREFNEANSGFSESKN